MFRSSTAKLKQAYDSVSAVCSRISFSPRNIPGNIKYTLKCVRYAVVFIGTFPLAQAETCFKKGEHDYTLKCSGNYETTITTALQYTTDCQISDINIENRKSCADFFTKKWTWGAGYFGAGSLCDLIYHEYSPLDDCIPSAIKDIVPDGQYGNAWDIIITTGIAAGGLCTLCCLFYLVSRCCKKPNDNEGYFLMEEGGSKKKWFGGFFSKKPKKNDDVCCCVASSVEMVGTGLAGACTIQ